MKKSMRATILISLAAVFLFAACSPIETPQSGNPSKPQRIESAPPAQLPAVEANSGFSGAQSQEGNAYPEALKAPLSDDAAAGLLYMYEEEKLARDVYQALYQVWGTPIFQNISQSESAHMEAVYQLLNSYGVDDAVSGNPAGQFENQDLQNLYNELVARGSGSLAEALKVGAKVEEIDILDLQAELALVSDAQVKAVYQNLLQGSENHLRSYVSILQNQTGEVYQPVHLNAEAYQAILGSNQAFGNGQRQGNGNQSRGGRGQGGKGRQGGQNGVVNPDGSL